MTFSFLHPMALPPAWTQSEMLVPLAGLLVAFGGLLLATCQFLKSEIRDSEARLREEMKASQAMQREELRASEARQREEMKASQAMQREEMKASEARQREELRASEARQREALLEVKGELRSLGSKLDRVLEGALSVKP